MIACDGMFQFSGRKKEKEKKTFFMFPNVLLTGIWDCQTSQEVIEFVRRGIAAKQELHLICENMMDNCLASTTEGGGVGCDNMTMIIVGLLQGKTKEEWYKCIADRVARGDGPCAPPEYGMFYLVYWFPPSQEYRQTNPSS